MLSQKRSHAQTLTNYERVYYNNYEYYNEFEQLQDYRNDISKLRFNNSRKSTTTIVLYDTLASNEEEPPEHESKPLIPRPTHHSNSSIIKIPKTVQDFFYQFASTYHEHNYSPSKPQRANLPKPHQIIVLYFYMHTLMDQFAKTEEEDFQQFCQILEKLKQEGLERKSLIENIYGEECESREETNQMLERWFAFEQYFTYLITTKLQAQNKQEKIENFYLFQYCQYFRWLLSEIAEGSKRSVLLSAIPYTPATNNAIHPLTLPLQFCLNKDSHSPKIIFLNLDGRQTYYNIRAIKRLPKQVRYISIFNEPSGSEMLNSPLQNGCEDFEVEASYSNLNLTHSELLFRELRIKDINGTYQPHSDNVLLYPLNSIYLRKSYAKMNQHSRKTLPKLETSSDIRWLWEERISGEVEQWSPQLIIVSYNGELDIEEEDFQAIMRDLTVLSDHRTILFTNLSGLYKRQEEETEESAEQEWQVSKVKMVEEFMGKYRDYSYQNVNEERFFNNMAYFIKCSSGNVSLKALERNKPLEKYSLPRRKLYLQRLSQLPEFEWHIVPSLQGTDLSSLFEHFAKRQKEQNQKENESWQRLIDEVLYGLRTRPPQSIEVQQRLEIGDLYKQLFQNEASYRIKQIEQNITEELRLIHEDYEGFVEEEMKDYFNRNRERLMLQNLEHYRYRKAYLPQEQEQGNLKFFRFCFDDEDQLLLEKYTQVIVDQRKLRVFVVNYRAEEGHIILYGDINDRSSLIKVQKINSRLEQSLSDMNLQSKSEVVRINYSYCFLRDKLYLFWPQQWDVKEYVRKKLLGLEYNPPHINFMLQIQYNYQERCYIIDELKWKAPESGLESLPKKGCTAIECGGNRFYIFGGIYDSHLDYYEPTSAISIAEIMPGQYSISQIPKRKDRHLNRSNYLKPKMGYRIEKQMIRNSEEGVNTITLTAGFGRNFTNYHSLQSFQSFNVLFQFQGIKIAQNIQNHYRIVRLEQPIERNTIGRYFVGPRGQQELKFSENVKDWMVAERRLDKNQPPQTEREVIAVFEDELRFNDFKVNHKRQYLFGWDRTIREKIYVPHCWSPQLQILSNGRLFIVNTALRAEQINNYTSCGQCIIPKEEDLISICLEQDRLWMLANCPILKSLENKNNFRLYEGSLANLYHLLSRKQLPMNQKYQFKNSCHPLSLREKTLYAQDNRIYLLGGFPADYNNTQLLNHLREDFILERVKDKFKMRVRKLQCQDCSLELPNPFVVRHRDQVLLYAVGMEQRSLATEREGQVKIEEKWFLKIQTLTTNEAAQDEILIKSALNIYQYDWQKRQIILRKGTLINPKIVKIIKFTRFSYTLLREYSEKVLAILSRQIPNEMPLQLLSILTTLSKETNSQVIDGLILENHHKNNILQHVHKQYLQICQAKGESQSIDNQQFVKILRALFRLMNKRILECIVENSEEELYEFVLEDSSSRKVKYIAIGQLKSTRLRFLRLRYKQELAICLNQTSEDELFFNSNALESEEIVPEKSKGVALQVQEEREEVYRINISFKN